MAENGIFIRRLSEEEKPSALVLIWEVFLKFEAPEYSSEGTEFFRSILDDKEYISEREFIGAFDGEKLVGVISMGRSPHINFFFVREEYHRRGIGRRLFETAVKSRPEKCITINASPYAVPVYRRLGFVPTDKMQETKGIKFLPMEYKKPLLTEVRQNDMINCKIV